MSELMMALMVWIGANSNYNTHIELPNVVFTTQHNMCALYGIHDKGRCDDARLRGFYDKDLTIYMDVDFDTSDPHSRSQLLHELVHYVQWSNGRQATTCLGHRGPQILDKELAAVGGSQALLDAKAVETLLAGVEAAGKLLAGKSQIRQLVDSLRAEIGRRLAGNGV